MIFGKGRSDLSHRVVDNLDNRILLLMDELSEESYRGF